MQTMILNHYPSVIKQIEEIKQIANAEDIEFSKLNLSADKIKKNMFILTADKTGVERFEHLLRITPKGTQSLEERKAVILFQANRRKMSLTELQTMLLDYLPGVQFFIDKVEMKLTVTIGIDAGRVEILRNIIDEILPLEIYFMLGYHDTFGSSVRHSMAITFIMVFYPQFNLSELFLDGRWELDGTHMLDGYDGGRRIDLHPVGIEYLPKVKEVLQEKTDIIFLMESKEVIASEQEMEIQASVDHYGTFEESITIQMETEVSVRVGEILMENQNFLDGDWALDGSRELNGGSYQW